MGVRKLYEFILTAVLLSYVMTIGQAEPITNQTAVELKFIKQRKKLQVARKINPIGGKMSKHHVESDPVCGMSTWDIVDLCVLVAERFFDDRGLAFGFPGKYKKSVMKPTPETCIKGRVLFQTYPQKAIRVNMYRCPMSNYIFEQQFELKDFYITSSSSRKKVYMLRDLYDKSPLHVGEFKEEMVWSPYGRLIPKSEARLRNPFPKLEQEDSVSSSEMDNTDEPLYMLEDVTTTNTDRMTSADDGVYFDYDGRVVGRLYALIDGLKLKRMHVHSERLKKNPNKIGFWRKLWNSMLDMFPRKTKP